MLEVRIQEHTHCILFWSSTLIEMSYFINLTII